MSDNHPSMQEQLLGFIAGALAGLVGDGMVHPVDTIRTRLQAQRTGEYKGMLDAWRKVVKGEGYFALFRGFGAVAALTMPAHALYFGSYEVSKKLLTRGKTGEAAEKPWVWFVSGFVADVFGSLIWVPMDVIKQRLQMGDSKSASVKYSSSYQAAKAIVREDGVPGLYRGALVALATFGPYVGIYFTLYETFKIRIANYTNIAVGELPMAFTLPSALLAASASALVTCPIDVVKTNIQVYSVKHGGHGNAWQASKALYKQNGFKVFFRGVNARILWLAPGSAITIASFDKVKSLLSYVFPKSK